MKRTQHWFRMLAVVGVAAALGACDESTGLESLDDEMVMDAALIAADATVEEVTMWGESLGFGAVPAPSQYDNTGSLAAMGRPGGRGSWSGEFSGTRSRTCYDEQGVEQDQCDELLTESIRFLRDIEGTIERGNFTAEISRLRDMTVSGLLGEETTRTWNGGGSSTTARSGVLDDGTERSHSVVGEFTFDDVVVPIPGTDPRWPLSGTISRSMTVTKVVGDETTVREVEMTVTFNGTQFADAVINGEAMEIDLDAREGRNPLRRGRG